MNASPAHQEFSRPAHELPHDPADLVGRWTRVHSGHHDRVGVLVHATRSIDAGTQGWDWSLRTPTGVVSGRGELRAAPLGDHDGGRVRAARRRLRATRADLAEFAPRDTAAEEVEADLELLEWEMAARP
ncbi:hypothetical protein [Nocardiopsis sp. LOL_012]|uniref:hypothetical protein n=1 Tax=Nocardiopsis sp. LOL_012 TaxID=3345409 RepID=UPI003A8A7EE4